MKEKKTLSSQKLMEIPFHVKFTRTRFILLLEKIEKERWKNITLMIKCGSKWRLCHKIDCRFELGHFPNF
jgi:hypothetical protein